MKLAIAVAAVLAMSSGAYAGFPGSTRQPCDDPPPGWAQKPPTIAPMIVDLHDSEMVEYCQKDIPADWHLYGCAFPKASPPMIFMNDAQTEAEYACTLRYEEAHLAPNNWQDRAIEALTPDRH